MSNYYNQQQPIMQPTMPVEREFSWDDTIQNDSDYKFELLPEGDYSFTVKSFERARFQGSEKMPPCNQAKLELVIVNPQTGNPITIRHSLFLHTKTEGLLCAFFIAIGQRKHGEPLRMDWNKVIGAQGRCKIRIRKWTGSNGETFESNDVSRFYEPNEPNNLNTPRQGFTAGQF